MIAKKVEEFILETILDQNWPLLLSFICFNLAYAIAKFPLCSFLLCIAGFAFLISVYFGTLSIVSTGRAVLITGCDSGFGNELAKKLNAMGFTVFAGCLDEKSDGAIELNRTGDETGQRLHVIQMNVTKQEEVDKALDYVEKHLPENGLWGLVNNAGQYGSPGCFEWIPTHVLEKEMSVNLFGAIRVTNAFLPLIRKSQGRIVNVSSIMDRMTSPFSGCYTITKGAIESYSAILRLEMKRFNVQVVVIEPGNFMAATNINKSNAGEDTCQSRRLWDQLDDKIKNDYGEDECFQQVISINRKLAEISTGEPHTVVDAMVNAVSRLYPKNRYFVATMSDKIMAYGMQFLPLWISDRLLLAIIDNPVLFDSMQYFKYVVLIPFFAALLWLGIMICM